MEEIQTVLPEHSPLPRLAPHLSRHLLFPLVEFEEGQAREREDAEALTKILKAKMHLLESTNMQDYLANLYCEVHGVNDPPAEYAQKRQVVMSQLEKLEAEAGKISELLMKEEVVTSLRSDKVANLEYLKKEHGVCYF